MEDVNEIQLLDYANKLESRESVSLEEYLETYKTRIVQESEQLFITDFLYPLFGETNIKHVIP